MGSGEAGNTPREGFLQESHLLVLARAERGVGMSGVWSRGRELSRS